MRYSNEQLSIAVASSLTWKEVCSKICGGTLTGSQYHAKKRAIQAGIDFKHFPGKANTGFARKPRTSKPISEYLIEKSAIISDRLKKRLFETGLKQKRCERCGLSKWLDNPIPLELHHVNGIHDDCRLENLKVLCPNCHSIETTNTPLAERQTLPV